MENSAPPVPHTPPVQTGTPTLGERVDDDAELTRLHPRYKTMLRLRATLTAVPLVIAVMVLEGQLASNVDAGWPLPWGFLSTIAAVIAIIFIIRLPSRRYMARGYQISDDRLRVVRGILWRSDTIVPFGRVQHIDVDQGPLERFFDIATMTLHTAGSHNASVHLPGLGHDLATQMREEIRAHIKRESM